MTTVLIIPFLVILYHFIISFAQPNDFQLELVQVLFRHGDRSPQKNEIYRTDPYAKVFKEHDYGLLTKIGMQREYKIGQMLRQRYNDFLGEFENNEVYAYSSDYDRTKMSLQLVLAGLYRPTAKTSWDADIHWTPIPTHYDPTNTNFLEANDACRRLVRNEHTHWKRITFRYYQLLKDAGKTPEIQEKLEKYNDFMDYLRNKTGITDLHPLSVYKLHNNIRSALSMGLPLPDWCSAEDFTKLKDLTIIQQRLMTHTPLMTRITVGSMVEQFLKNIDDNEKGMNKRKIYLYSGHDINLAMFSDAHEFTDIPENPDYGSALMIEKLRGPDYQVYLRMVLWTGASEQLIPVEVKNCSHECPLSDYKSWVLPIMPDEEARACFLTYSCNRNT